MPWSLSRLSSKFRKTAGPGETSPSLLAAAVESNNSWLLGDTCAQAEAELITDPQSSFRFSFSSQAEAETAASAVLLLVSLEDETDGERLLHWRRLESLERSISPVAAAVVRFSYAEIRRATRDFSAGRELGRGALSRVYKGRIGMGRRAVAIKRVDGREAESRKAFCRELMIASSLCHLNVVPLIGFCVDFHGLFLVYKYVSGGSLDHHLHPHDYNGRKKKKKVLSWEVRYKVAIGVARAVEHLHHGIDKCVVHRDIKPSNILISSKRIAKLCDFGLATWISGPSLPFLCKSVKGTFGYLAPEYFQHGKLSDKTDVYALGVVLLELITGRKAIDQTLPQGDENLVLWAKPLLEQGTKAIGRLVDPRLKPTSRRWREISRVLCAATACLSSEESARPSIEKVIGMLEGEESGIGNGNGMSWSVLRNSGCVSGYGAQLCGSLDKSDLRGHVALAMLGVSDTEDADIYGG